MTGKTHQIIGITCGLSYFLATTEPAYGPATLGAVIVGSHLAALLPDFDDAAADFWNSIPFGHAAGRILDPLVKHRHVSHSAIGYALFGIACYFVLGMMPSYWGINAHAVWWASMVAYFSHIFLDMLTAEGVPLLLPYKEHFGIPPKPLEGFRIVTGKWFENLVIFPIANLALITIVAAEWQQIRSYLFK